MRSYKYSPLLLPVSEVFFERGGARLLFVLFLLFYLKERHQHQKVFFIYLLALNRVHLPDLNSTDLAILTSENGWSSTHLISKTSIMTQPPFVFFNPCFKKVVRENILGANILKHTHASVFFFFSIV